MKTKTKHETRKIYHYNFI